MITLCTSGPMFGLPHPSPFVIKADVLLKMSGLEYREAPMTFSGAPKGKVPYISDDGVVLGDSYFIRRRLETKYKIDYSGATRQRHWRSAGRSRECWRSTSIFSVSMNAG